MTHLSRDRSLSLAKAAVQRTQSPLLNGPPRGPEDGVHFSPLRTRHVLLREDLARMRVEFADRCRCSRGVPRRPTRRARARVPRARASPGRAFAQARPRERASRVLAVERAGRSGAGGLRAGVLARGSLEL